MYDKISLPKQFFSGSQFAWPWLGRFIKSRAGNSAARLGLLEPVTAMGTLPSWISGAPFTSLIFFVTLRDVP